MMFFVLLYFSSMISSQVGEANSLVIKVERRVDPSQEEVTDDPEFHVAVAYKATDTFLRSLIYGTQAEGLLGNLERPTTEAQADAWRGVTGEGVESRSSDLRSGSGPRDGGVGASDGMLISDEKGGSRVNNSRMSGGHGTIVHGHTVKLNLPIRLLCDIRPSKLARIEGFINATERKLGVVTGEFEGEYTFGGLVVGDETLKDGVGMELGDVFERHAKETVSGKAVGCETSGIAQGCSEGLTWGLED